MMTFTFEPWPSNWLVGPYLPYLTFGSSVGNIQRSDHQMGPLSFPDKSEAKEISQKLWQASGVKANVCYLNKYSPYS